MPEPPKNSDRHQPPAEHVSRRGVVVRPDVEDRVGPDPRADLAWREQLGQAREDQGESGGIADDAEHEENEAPGADHRPAVNAAHDDAGRQTAASPGQDGIGLIERGDLIGAPEGLQDRHEPLIGQLAARLGALEDVPPNLLQDFGDFIGGQLVEASAQLGQVRIDFLLESLGVIHGASFASSGSINEAIRDKNVEAYRAIAPARRRPAAVSQ